MLIIRHGESEWNREGRWQGWEDISLTTVGEAQARARGAELRAAGHGFRAVHSSDLSRARRTAELIATALELEHPTVQSDLRERFGGEWQGHNREEIDAGWPGQRAAWRRGELTAPPGGESDADVLTRCHRALGAIDATTEPGAVLVVTHGGVLRLLATQAGVPPDELIPNLGGRWFDLHDGALHARDPLSELTTATAPVTE